MVEPAAGPLCPAPKLNVPEAATVPEAAPLIPNALLAPEPPKVKGDGVVVPPNSRPVVLLLVV